MRVYENYVIESAQDITLADEAGLLDRAPTECDECGTALMLPFSIRLDEQDFSVFACSGCIPIPKK